MSYRSYHKGQEAEGWAVDFLVRQGFKIIERNYHSPFGEIDIIAQEGRALVFVEVRMRNEADQIHPLETISRGKQNRLMRTAQMYLAGLKDEYLQCRFDIVAIIEENGNPKIQLHRHMIER